jgi:two-component system cell cycle response regulator
VVEDSAPQAHILKHQLEADDYEVAISANGVEALAYLEKERPGLIISDVLMPEMDGYELCRRVKAADRTRSVPVMLLTALSEPEDIIRGLECGADNFVTKPYDRDFLLSRVEYILVNREIRKRSHTGMGVETYFAGKRQFVSSDRIQILDLLLTTYEDALRQKRKLEKALATIKVLRGIIPICASCKSIRNDEGYWQQLESYLRAHSEADFSHGLCPECLKKIYSEHASEFGLLPQDT